jgi:hydroxyacylglutathione hydrolase
MILRHIPHPATGCASYLFGCTGKAKLAVVDPHFEHIDDYLVAAHQASSPIVAIFETHVQADHVSGAPQARGSHSCADLFAHVRASMTTTSCPA